MVAQTAPTRLVRVRIFNNLCSIRKIACYNRSLASWVKLAFYFQNFDINNPNDKSVNLNINYGN